MAAFHQSSCSLPEYVVKVLDMFQYQAKTDEIIQITSKGPVTKYICLCKRDMRGYYFSSRMCKHLLRKIDRCYLLCFLRQPNCVFSRTTTDLQAPVERDSIEETA